MIFKGISDSFQMSKLFEKYSAIQHMSHLNYSILTFSTYLSGNTVWPQASGFQKIAKIDHFLHFDELLPTQIVNVARFARNVDCDFFFDFQTLCMLSWFLIFPYLVLTIFTLILIHFGYILIHFWHENSNI